MAFNVVGIGEALWDLLPTGRQLGGAPSNFAWHAHALGAEASVVTRVGNDSLGQEIIQRFKERGLPEGSVQIDNDAPTGIVTVTLDAGGIPHFTIHENVAWDRMVLTDAAREVIKAADAVCFGSLAQRNPVSSSTIQQLVAASSSDTLRVFDINLRQKFYSREVIEKSLHLANVLKLNDSELPILAQMFGLGGSSSKQIEQLAGVFRLGLVVLTRGSEGSLIHNEGRWSIQPPQTVQIVDTVGAGDSFTAALVMGLLNRMDLDELHAAAAEVAGYVCSQAGATPSLPLHLRGKFTGGVTRNS